MPVDKAPGAFRTIGELSQEIGVPRHILRYWETRFSQLRPLQRAGNRRYYRPEDAALVRRIDALLNRDGYTIRGVQTLLKNEGLKNEGLRNHAPMTQALPQGHAARAIDIDALRSVRDRLAAALAAD